MPPDRAADSLKLHHPSPRATGPYRRRTGWRHSDSCRGTFLPNAWCRDPRLPPP